MILTENQQGYHLGIGGLAETIEKIAITEGRIWWRHTNAAAAAPSSRVPAVSLPQWWRSSYFPPHTFATTVALLVLPAVLFGDNFYPL
jgi:hypothetical protein